MVDDIASKLTIVIPCHGRQWMLKRCLTYHVPLGCRIIVTDSSDDPAHEALEFPTIDYIHRPKMEYRFKLREAFEMVQTEFLVIIPDDDFMILPSLHSCVEFLADHESYVGVQGEFRKFSTLNLTLTEPGYGRAQYRHKIADDFYSESPVERIRYMFKHFMMVNQSVVRTAAMSSLLHMITDHPHLMPIKFSDKIVGHHFACWGNFKTLPIHYSMRDDDRLVNKKEYPAEQMRDIPFEMIFDSLAKHGDPLSDYLSRQADIPVEAARLHTHGIYMEYLSRLAEKASFRDIPNVPLPSEDPLNRSHIEEIFQLVSQYPNPNS